MKRSWMGRVDLVIAKLKVWYGPARRMVERRFKPLPPADAALCRNMRQFAASSGCLCYTVRSKIHGSIAIFKEDIDGCATDWELIEFIRCRCG